MPGHIEVFVTQFGYGLSANTVVAETFVVPAARSCAFTGLGSTLGGGCWRTLAVNRLAGALAFGGKRFPYVRSAGVVSAPAAL